MGQQARLCMLPSLVLTIITMLRMKTHSSLKESGLHASLSTRRVAGKELRDGDIEPANATLGVSLSILLE